MADSTASKSDAARHYTWFILSLLIVGHAVFNALANPFYGERTYLHLMAMGVAFSQPLLFASWIVIGPPPATTRLPLTIVAFIAIILAGAMSNVTWLSPDYVLIASALFAVSAMVTSMVASLAGWRIYHSSREADTEAPLSRFSLKYLLAITTIVAALLGIGQSVVSRQVWRHSQPWQDLMLELLMPISLILLAMIPTLVAPLFVLSVRPRARILVFVAFLGACLMLLAVEIMVAVEPAPRLEIARVIGFVQLGAAAGGAASALLLRIAGFRLVSRRSALSDPIPQRP